MNTLFNYLLLVSVLYVEGVSFDRFSGKKVEEAQSKELRLKNATERCSIEIRACTPHEGSRVDGTCNNYKNPSQGAARGPYLRLLKPDYANSGGRVKKGCFVTSREVSCDTTYPDYLRLNEIRDLQLIIINFLELEIARTKLQGGSYKIIKHKSSERDIRKNKHGEPLPSARKVRTTLQTTGRVEDKKTFTAAAGNMLELILRDVSLLSGPNDYLKKRQYCCLERGKSDPRCIPISVPKDDPYLKVTDINCLNFSRAETFQDSGCTPEIIPPEQINFQTPLLDLSTIYGVDAKSLAKIRKGEYGLLILERRGDRYVPLNISNAPDAAEKINLTNTDNSTIENVIANIDDNTDGAANVIANNATNNEDICIQNMVNESICYQFGFPEAGNYNLRTTTLGIFFMREHNRIATALHKINPCWKDDRLFKVARQINIATAANIFMYELLPPLLGYRNMLNHGILSDHVEQVATYMEEVPPLVYAEFEIALRFFNTMLDGRIKKYTEKHHYSGELSVSETLYRQALIEQDRNFEEINRGTFYQSAGRIDDILDPEISENFFGDLQKAHDLGAISIQRGRDMGIRGYNDYRHLCGLKPVKKFEELIDVMEVEKMEALRSLYKDVDDIDLLAGIISENYLQGTYVGPTLFCIMSKQLQIFRYSDRFWYERGDQIHSFSIGQLHEIRKTSIASVACDNAEGIKFIQPQAFYNVKPGNTPVPCTHIDRPDLRMWRDNSCFKPKYSHEATHVPMSFMEQGTVSNFSRFFEDLLFYRPNHMLPKNEYNNKNFWSFLST